MTILTSITEANLYSMCITHRSPTPDLWSHANIHMHAIFSTYSSKDALWTCQVYRFSLTQLSANITPDTDRRPN